MLSTNTWRDDRIMSILTLTAWTTVQSSSTLVVEYRQRKIEEQRVLVERVDARRLEALGKRAGRPAHAGDTDNERVVWIDIERATGVGDERQGEVGLSGKEESPKNGSVGVTIVGVTSRARTSHVRRAMSSASGTSPTAMSLSATNLASVGVGSVRSAPRKTARRAVTMVVALASARWCRAAGSGRISDCVDDVGCDAGRRLSEGA